jgi:hypothetical protein
MKYTKEYTPDEKIKYYNITLYHKELKSTINFIATPKQIEILDKTGIFTAGNLTIDQKRDFMVLYCKQFKFTLNCKGDDIAECLLWITTTSNNNVVENVFYEVTPIESDSDSESMSI